MRALITGDRGFLGRHFSAELKARGYEVYGLDVKASSAQDCRAYFRQDIVHQQAGGDSPDFDLVVHCAAVVGGRETIENDPLATAESLSIDADMFRWAAVARPGRVLYISSSAAYPVELQRMDIYTVPWRLKEDDAWFADTVGMPDEVYGWSKVTGELLADRLRRTGVPVTVVRPFSGYGADQDQAYPFRAILDRARALEPEQALEIWSDGVRDWIHVDDLVRGALAVADSGTELPVNLCTGRATPFSELAGIMLRALGKPTRYRVLDDRPKGVAYRVGDPSRLNGIYQPQVSLEEGVRRALDGS
jgi:nucleoside-diphosphate-sugar epimerase